MSNKIIIVRYCEIHLKGKNRGYFEKVLEENIKNALKDYSLQVRRIQARVLIENFNENEVEEICSRVEKVCGIHSYSVAEITETSLDNIFAICERLCDFKGTFKVETNRADKRFPLNSMEISREIGGRLLSKFSQLKVDVVNPEHVFKIDIRENGQTFVYLNEKKCVGGMPVGTAGKGLLLLSGGIDSPVAGFMMMKRGMTVDALHFHSYPYTSENAKEKVLELAKIISNYSNKLRLNIVSFTKIQEAIHKYCPEEYMITIMRRFMMRIAERIALKTGCQAIITGESLGQVASQTIESMTSSNSVVTMPVLRPVVGFDKLDIIDIAKKIDSYDVSIRPYEDCCTVFLPKFPIIKPHLDKVVKFESVLNIEELVEEAIATLEVVEF